MENQPHGFSLFRVHHYFARFFILVQTEETAVGKADLAVRHALALSTDDVLGNGEAFFLCKARHDGDDYSHVDFFFPLIGREKPVVKENGAVNIKVSEKFAQLYNECRLNNTQTPLTDISELICRTLFCCVIDSMGLLMTGDSSLYVIAQKYTDETGRDFSNYMATLYRTMKQEDHSNLPIHFRQVNYIDSRLFDKDISNISFTKSMRSLMLEIMSFDWSDVDPEILDSLI